MATVLEKEKELNFVRRNLINRPAQQIKKTIEKHQKNYTLIC